jgi:membrane protein implicated in regulation of membrane protease activity
MKPFTRLAVVVLWLIAVPQLLRFIAGGEIILNGAPVPLWLSMLVGVLAASLAVMVWREQHPRVVRTRCPASGQAESGGRMRGFRGDAAARADPEEWAVKVEESAAVRRPSKPPAVPT